jgi:xanthine dehydrogenase iron-sulfur cluster and FAD-binding subunit A
VSTSIQVNGFSYNAARADRLLLDWLREDLDLKGTKYGCGEGECGACTVLVDGEARLACLTTVGAVVGRSVTTIEGLVGDPAAEPIIEALAAADGVQCGFCTPGMVMALAATTTPSDPSGSIAGNLCRCTGYRPLVGPVPLPPRRAGAGRALPAFSANGYQRPADLGTALALLAKHPQTILAGGTDLLVAGNCKHPILDVTNLPELAEIRETPGAIRIGAGVSFTRLIGSVLVQTWCRPLAQAAGVVGGRQIQNQGTIGGNIANASPAADTLPALAVLGAEVELRSAAAIRTVPIEEFCTAPGRTVLGPDELITAIIVPKAAPDSLAFFVKVGPRRAQAISIVSVAVRARADGSRLSGVRVSFGAVSPVVTCDTAVAAVLESGPLTADLVRIATAQSAATPISDLRATALYRKRLLSGALLRGFADAQVLYPAFGS